MDLPGSVSTSIGIIGAGAIRAGELAAIAAYPWLGLPVIKQIWEAIFEKFSNAVIKSLQQDSFRILIPLIDKAQAEAAQKASLELKKKLDDANASAESLQGALDEFKQKYADLIRMRESSP